MSDMINVEKNKMFIHPLQRTGDYLVFTIKAETVVWCHTSNKLQCYCHRSIFLADKLGISHLELSC